MRAWNHAGSIRRSAALSDPLSNVRPGCHTGGVGDPSGDGVAVAFSRDQGFEDEEVEGALEEVEIVARCCVPLRC